MPSAPPSLCSEPACADLADAGSSACTTHRWQRSRDVDRARGARGYTTRGHRRRFRLGVLRRDPLCVLCRRVASVADHWPTSRRDLLEHGLDPDDPARGRGLCKACHDHQTAVHQPGGWNAR